MKHICFLILGILLISLTGCSVEDASNKKLRDLEFTVVENSEVPEELQKIIDEKKQTEFKITYTDKENLYICRGYGEQKTGGYSIAVNNLYLTSNAIYFSTNLIGPSKDATVNQVLTYPYIVVKTEFIDKSVVFD